jgi:6-pyruvoyltetrahydropterin/6-carboxytetrahydropterin synthase
MWELTKTFRFEAAHTLMRAVESEASRRIHGHSYRVVIAVRGKPDPQTGMLIDLGALEVQLAEARACLDHRLLDQVPDLGPATLENLSTWIWRQLVPVAPGLSRVTVHRDSLDESSSYFGPDSR